MSVRMRGFGEIHQRYQEMWKKELSAYVKRSMQPQAINCRHRLKGLCQCTKTKDSRCILDDTSPVNRIGGNSCAEFGLFSVKELESIFKNMVVSGNARSLSELYWVLGTPRDGILGMWNKMLSFLSFK